MTAIDDGDMNNTSNIWIEMQGRERDREKKSKKKWLTLSVHMAFWQQFSNTSIVTTKEIGNIWPNKHIRQGQ